MEHPALPRLRAEGRGCFVSGWTLLTDPEIYIAGQGSGWCGDDDRACRGSRGDRCHDVCVGGHLEDIGFHTVEGDAAGARRKSTAVGRLPA